MGSTSPYVMQSTVAKNVTVPIEKSWINYGAAYLPLHKRHNLPYRSFSSPRQITSFEAIHQAHEFQQVNYAK
jgi:hypothetical protein